MNMHYADYVVTYAFPLLLLVFDGKRMFCYSLSFVESSSISSLYHSMKWNECCKVSLSSVCMAACFRIICTLILV